MDTHTLLIRAAAPFQSWGTLDDGTHDVRHTERVPTKSAIIGILANALGIYGTDAIAGQLSELRMGVRVDAPGFLISDFQIIGSYGEGIRYADGKVGGKLTTNRYYLADGDFLIGLENTDPNYLESIHAALRRPASPLYLGRKACVPGVPIWIPDGLQRETTLETALQTYPWPRMGLTAPEPAHAHRLRTFVEIRDGAYADYNLTDSPTRRSFLNPEERKHRFREGSLASRRIKESILTVAVHGAGVPTRKEPHDDD